ncbi:MAG TPA: aldose 1-epimerase family protein [Nocardioides sp.]|uniref:aldose 1-epimerase family protein n=1 Tax=Nocardioides sp. TaxID=35761 RepID=UPI002CEDDF14|nr:aldose 1-epimerase family protein [Nocardioides sp.]HTW15988.1 aldose 1-epimerase family protein [Nocardioides sp.]
MHTRPPSGEQFRIAHGDASAEVTQVGATLRSYAVGGTPVLDGFDVTERATDGRGQVLAPWPNRIADGRYSYGGREVRCPLNEPDRGDAIHGIVRWSDWSVLDHTGADVTLACAVRPQPGYEWALALRVGYHLDDGGLTVTLTAANTGTERAPFGAGFHPYLRLGDRHLDDLCLAVPAGCRVRTDVGCDTVEEPVAGTAWDLRGGRPLRGLVLDTAYGCLGRRLDGRAVAVLADPEGAHEVALWVDEAFPYLMVYSADQVRDPGRRRRAVAVEPMSCPPQAFRTGTDVVHLEPGEGWRGRWGILPG